MGSMRSFKFLLSNLTQTKKIVPALTYLSDYYAQMKQYQHLDSYSQIKIWLAFERISEVTTILYNNIVMFFIFPMHSLRKYIRNC